MHLVSNHYTCTNQVDGVMISTSVVYYTIMAFLGGGHTNCQLVTS